MDEDDVLVVDDKNRKDLHGRAKDWEAWVGGWVGGVLCLGPYISAFLLSLQNYAESPLG